MLSPLFSASKRVLFLSSLPVGGRNWVVRGVLAFTPGITYGSSLASMDSNNWQPAQGGGETTMDTADWRSQLPPESRQRIVNKMLEGLKRHLPFSGQEVLLELKKIAARFEEKIFTAATSQSDYLRKISVKVLTMENNNTQKTMTSNGSNPPNTDWRSQLPPESRQRIVNKMSEVLKRHFPFSGQEGLLERKKIAARFEEKIFTAATSQSDYLRKISVKMLTMENNKTQNTREAMTNNGSNPPNTDLSL